MSQDTETLRAFAQEVKEKIEAVQRRSVAHGRRSWRSRPKWEGSLLKRAKEILGEDKPQPTQDDPSQLRLPGV